jgi:hypothetical protein
VSRKSYREKIRARAKRGLDRAVQNAHDTGEGNVGKMVRSIEFRKTKVMAARARRKHGDPEQPLAKQVEVENKLKNKLKKESYTMLGDILAEAILGKIRTKVADKLDKFSREQYRKGEVDDASGKERRAGLRGKVAHFVGKASQKVRPKNEG